MDEATEILIAVAEGYCFMLQGRVGIWYCLDCHAQDEIARSTRIPDVEIAQKKIQHSDDCLVTRARKLLQEKTHA